MTTSARFAALALAVAALGTERGRGCLGSVLITLGSELLPREPPGPAREQRIRDRVMAEIRNHPPAASRNGHKGPAL